ncbi:MAG: hypothetical protein AAFR61_21695 [Bacteroidota bacterium]
MINKALIYLFVLLGLLACRSQGPDSDLSATDRLQAQMDALAQGLDNPWKQKILRQHMRLDWMEHATQPVDSAWIAEHVFLFRWQNRDLGQVRYSPEMFPGIKDYTIELLVFGADSVVMDTLLLHGGKEKFGRIILSDWNRDGDNNITHGRQSAHQLSGKAGWAMEYEVLKWHPQDSAYREIFAYQQEIRACAGEDGQRKVTYTEWPEAGEMLITYGESTFACDSYWLNYENQPSRLESLPNQDSLWYRWDEEKFAYLPVPKQ